MRTIPVLPRSFAAVLLRAVVQRLGARKGRATDHALHVGLRLLEDHEREQAVRFEQLRADVQQGIDQLDAGQGRELTDDVFEEIKVRVRAELARRRSKSGGG